jgi:uncharacterized protein YlxW (UPF0749 family)
VRKGTTGSRSRRWALLVPLIAALAGFLFTTTARTAAGTALRDDRRPELSRLITDQESQVAQEADTAAGLRSRIDAITQAQAGSDGRIQQQTQRADSERQDAGLSPLHGPGLIVHLDDEGWRVDPSV